MYLSTTENDIVCLYRLSDQGHRVDKPSYINIIDCLANFQRVFAGIETHIYADNITDQTRQQLHDLQVPLLECKLGNSESFKKILDYAVALPNPDTIVYFVEDDYVHMEGSPTVIREGLQRAEYVSLYDHGDKYDAHHADHQIRIVVTKSSHWRTALDTCMTFASRVKTLRADYDVIVAALQTAIPQDAKMFQELRFARKRSLLTAIPGKATHGQYPFLSPTVNWEREMI